MMVVVVVFGVSGCGKIDQKSEIKNLEKRFGNFTALTINKSGFYTPGDVKGMNKIVIDGVLHLAIINNNDIIQFFKLN